MKSRLQAHLRRTSGDAPFDSMQPTMPIRLPPKPWFRLVATTGNELEIAERRENIP